MFRSIFWFSVWTLTLGIMDIYVSYNDGLEIELHSLWFKNN